MGRDGTRRSGRRDLIEWILCLLVFAFYYSFPLLSAYYLRSSNHHLWHEEYISKIQTTTTAAAADEMMLFWCKRASKRVETGAKTIEPARERMRERGRNIRLSHPSSNKQQLKLNSTQLLESDKRGINFEWAFECNQSHIFAAYLVVCSEEARKQQADRQDGRKGE